VGSVICVYRIMPSDPKQFEAVKKALQALKPEKLEEEPIAFGIKALRFVKLIPDAGGEIEKLENKLNSIKNITVEEISVSRSL